MKRDLLLSGILLLSACSRLPASHSAEAEALSPHAVAETEARASTVEPAKDRRRVGELVVHRFTGSFHRTPLVLSEEVIDRDGKLWVVDLTLEDGSKTSRFRVRMDDEGLVSAASRMDGEREIPGALAEYHALIDSTVFSADSNDGLIASEKSTCLLGSRELDCETKSYRVRVADKSATLKVSESRELPGRDLAGEIVSDEGRVLYRSQIIAVEQQKPAKSVAAR